jgi:peptidoglycan/LPS O-acetylase OafA/YrhL
MLNSLFLLPSSSHVIGVAWTLVFEMYFYYLFASWLVVRNRTVALTGLCASLFALWALASCISPAGSYRRYLSDPIVIEFAFGMALAWAHRSGWRIKHAAACSAFSIAAITLAAMNVPSDGTAALLPEIRYWAWGIPAAVLVAVALREYRARSLFPRLLVGLGDSSYALYLTHSILMTAYARLLKVPFLAHLMNPVLWISFVVALCLLTAWITHRSIEIRLLRLLSGRANASKPVAQAVGLRN